MNFPFHVCVCLTWFLLMCPLRSNGEKDAKDILKEIAEDSGRELTESHLSEILACANDQTGCDKTLQTVLKNEIKLRGSFYKIDHDCNQSSQDRAPDFEKSVPEYIAWQEEAIKRGHNKTHNVGLCNPFKSLQCLEYNDGSGRQQCDCIVAGMYTNADLDDRCTAEYGSPCYTNDYSQFYDPLSFMAGGTLSMSSTADPSFALCQGPQREKPQETCTRLIYFNVPMCVNNNLTQKIKDLDQYFSGVTTLSLGQACVQVEDKQLYTISDEEKMTMAIRLQALEKLKNRGRNFCDTQKFLTCGASNKCECRYPTLLDKASGKCVLQLQFNECDMKGAAKNFTSNRTLVALARRNLRDAYKDLVQVCPGKMSCKLDRFDTFCNCGVPDKTGVNCDIQLADLMTTPKLRILPMDAPSNEEKWTPFMELNNKAKELSTKHSLKVGDTCNLEADDALKYFIAKLRGLMRSPSINLTMADYVNLTQQVGAFTNGAKRVCSQKPNAQGVFERCHNQTKKCFAAQNQEKDIEYMISRFYKHRTLLCGEISPNITPDDYEGGEYLFTITDLELLLLSGTRYCALGLGRRSTNGGPFKCECDDIGRNDSNCCRQVKKDVDTLLGINVADSSVHSMHGPKNWIQKTVWMSILSLPTFAQLNY